MRIYWCHSKGPSQIVSFWLAVSSKSFPEVSTDFFFTFNQRLSLSVVPFNSSGRGGRVFIASPQIKKPFNSTASWQLNIIAGSATTVLKKTSVFSPYYHNHREQSVQQLPPPHSTLLAHHLLPHRSRQKDTTTFCNNSHNFLELSKCLIAWPKTIINTQRVTATAAVGRPRPVESLCPI